MCAEIVNLRQFRKQANRAEKERQADENRIKFGRTKEEKQLTKAVRDLEARKLDAGRLEKDDSKD